ncbi:hypothetical protein QCA50_006095 [Cerrena zonata]|uniref:Uncharacterized protein n=1 Tax=Cerrena zonata TaxID=2478898 RepID=A0AAW0GGX0_9APHY
MSNMFNGSTLAPGKYIISSPMAGNAPVGRLGNIVVVLPNGEQPPIWTVEKPDYVIASNSGLGTNGWIAAEEAPVTIRVLIVGPRIPPYYPPNEYFTFIPVEA